MFHKVKAVKALPDYRLSVQFAEGVTKLYDVKPLFVNGRSFRIFENDPELFASVKVDVGGYGIIWNDTLDLSCDELLRMVRLLKRHLTRLMAFTDATRIWGLNESTIRTGNLLWQAG